MAIKLFDEPENCRISDIDDSPPDNSELSDQNDVHRFLCKATGRLNNNVPLSFHINTLKSSPGQNNKLDKMDPVSRKLK